MRNNFLLVYCAAPAERACIAGQLNMGETLHARHRHLVMVFIDGSAGQLATALGTRRRVQAEAHVIV